MIAGLFVVTGKDYIALCKQLAKEASNCRELEKQNDDVRLFLYPARFPAYGRHFGAGFH